MAGEPTREGREKNGSLAFSVQLECFEFAKTEPPSTPTFLVAIAERMSGNPPIAG
jgi:hypothetical protein